MLGRLVTRRPWRVLVTAALVLLASFAVAASTVGSLSLNRYEAPGSESAAARSLLAERFGTGSPNVALLVAPASGTVDDATVDVTARGYDAGIRIGEYVERDMVAVRLTRDIAWSVVGSPAYLDARGRPERPEELTGHEAIRYRFPASGVLYRWEFERNGRALTVDPPGSLIVNDGGLLFAFARAGLGLSYVADIAVAAELASGQLEQVLQAFLPRTPGLFLYFPRRAQDQPKLRAFIDVARAVLRPGR